MSRDPYRSSANDVDRREYDRVVYERDRDRRGDERTRVEDDGLVYTSTTSRRPPAPTRVRERDSGDGRTFEDDESIVHERRNYADDDDDNDSLILPASSRRRRRPNLPVVIPDDDDSSSRVTVERERVRVREDDRGPLPPPPRPGQLVRRQSSLDTFDRRPARRAYDFQRFEETQDRRPGPGPEPGVPIPLPYRRRRRDSSDERSVDRPSSRERDRAREHDRDRERERNVTTEIEEIRFEPDPYGPPRPRDSERELVREREIVRTRRESRSSSRGNTSRRGEASRTRSSRRPRSPSVSSAASESSHGGDSGAPLKEPRDEYPKKGKTRIPARLVSERALIDLHYPFIKEGNTIVVQVALGQDNIDDVLRLSRSYKKSEKETDVVNTETTKIKTSGGTFVEEKRRYEEYSTSPAARLPPPAPAPPQAVAMAPAPAPADYTTTIKIRDGSPARSYPAATVSNAAMSTALVRARSQSRPRYGPRYQEGAVIIDAGSPQVEYSEQVAGGPLALVAVEDRRRHRRGHSRSHSHGDGALYAHFHDRRDRDYDYYDPHDYHDHHDHPREHRYVYEERGYYDNPSRELVRTERLSNGDVVLYEETVDIKEPRHGVRIEKDKKGRMAISVPKYRY